MKRISKPVEVASPCRAFLVLGNALPVAVLVRLVVEDVAATVWSSLAIRPVRRLYDFTLSALAENMLATRPLSAINAVDEDWLARPIL